MTGHFYKNLNLHQLILDKRPKVILEVGSGDGLCTRLLAALAPSVPCVIHAISDKVLDIPSVQWTTGISYKEIKKLADNSIGLCIIDTDHNYWTLEQELLALIPKMEEGGLVVLHDVEEFYYNTGMAMSYWNNEPYPEKEILASAVKGGTGLCLLDFLVACRGTFKLVRWIPEHYGCAVIIKRITTGTQLVQPGPDSVFARPT